MDRHCDQLVSRGEPGPALRALLRLTGVALMLLALWLCTGLWCGGNHRLAGGLSVVALARIQRPVTATAEMGLRGMTVCAFSRALAGGFAIYVQLGWLL